MSMKSLVILPNNLGDVIMASPMLEGLAQSGEEITFFVEKGYEAGLVNLPSCHRIFRFDRKSIRDAAQTPDWRKATSLFADMIGELRKERFDRVINLSQHNYTAYIVSLLGCRFAGRTFLREGNQALPDPWSQYLYAIPFARRYNRLHASDVYRKIAGVAHIPSTERLVLSEEEKKAAGEFLAPRKSVDEKPLILLQPGAAIPSKRWPLDHFISLGKMLLNSGYRILVTGAPAEVTLASMLTERLGEDVINTAGEFSFRETIAMLPFVEGVVTGDTAIMHAAAALNRKVFALFGSTSPVETGPYGAGHFVFAGRCTSRPCFCTECKTHICMRSILPDEVFGVIRNAQGTTHCDLYRTGFDDEGLFKCTPVTERGIPFSSPVGAALTRRMIEPDYQPSLSEGDLEGVTRESELFIGALTSAIGELVAYSEKGDYSAVSRYEKAHAELPYDGINGFWSALLNLRLNSIPLLDPVAAVHQTFTVCTTTREEIEVAFRLKPA